MRQTNSCLYHTMSSLLACCSDVSWQRHTMRAKSRQDISALGGQPPAGRLAAWLDSDSSVLWHDWHGVCKGWNRQRLSLPLWSAAIFSIFLSSLCLCFWLSFFSYFPVVFFFSNFPRYLCKFFARRCVDDAKVKATATATSAGAGFVFMFRKSKFRYLQIAGQASLFPLAVLWPTFRFFYPPSLFFSVCQSEFFLRKRLSQIFYGCDKFASCRQQNKGQILRNILKGAFCAHFHGSCKSSRPREGLWTEEIAQLLNWKRQETIFNNIIVL